MCTKAVDDFLSALKFVPNWFFTNKVIKKLLTALYADDNIVFFDKYFGNATFCCNHLGTLSENRNNINLGDSNHDEDDPETIIHIRLLAWHIEFEKSKTFKKDINKELMLVACHPKRWLNF